MYFKILEEFIDDFERIVYVFSIKNVCANCCFFIKKNGMQNYLKHNFI
jgi:hypothetical protein